MRKLPLIAAALAVAVAGPGAGVADAAKKPSKTTYYLALGDSLAAGYQKDAEGKVLFSENSYVNRLYRQARKTDKRLKLVNLSCPGEDTTTFLDGGCAFPGYGETSQYRRAVDFLEKHRKRTRFITLSLGGNEFTPCAKEGGVDVGCALDGLQTLNRQLPEVAAKLRKAAGSNVRIAAQNQYNPFLALHLQGGPGADLAKSAAMLAQQVNIGTRNAMAPAKVRVADVYGAFKSPDLDTMVAFNGAQIPVAVARICEWTQMCLPAPQGNIHPNDAGFAVIAKEFSRALKLNKGRSKPKGKAKR